MLYEVITVLEHGLLSAGDTSETAIGSFDVSASDGIDTVVIGGKTFEVADLQALNDVPAPNVADYP